MIKIKHNKKMLKEDMKAMCDKLNHLFKGITSSLLSILSNIYKNTLKEVI